MFRSDIFKKCICFELVSLYIDIFIIVKNGINLID